MRWGVERHFVAKVEMVMRCLCICGVFCERWVCVSVKGCSSNYHVACEVSQRR